LYAIQFSGVTRGGRGGVADRLTGDTIQGRVTPEYNKKAVAELFRKKHQINDDGGSGQNTTAKKVITLQRAMAKNFVGIFRKKIGDIISCRLG